MFELPELWFTAAELQALIVMQRRLKDLGSGLLEEHLGPLSNRIDELIRHRNLNLGEAARLRFPTIAARSPGEAFQIAASATLQRKQLRKEWQAPRWKGVKRDYEAKGVVRLRGTVKIE